MATVMALELVKEELTKWRHVLHSMPELAFNEHQTRGFLRHKLKSFPGIDQMKEMKSGGLVAVIHGTGFDAGNPGRKIMLRAEMDALPIVEKTGAAYASIYPGVMHACGHDGHMSMLLGAARYLGASKDFGGTVYVLFQPAEEKGGGAKKLMDEGLFRDFPADAIYGLHNFPLMPLGMMATRPGDWLAAVEPFEIKLTGAGGHISRLSASENLPELAAEIVASLKGIRKNYISNPAEALMAVPSIETSSNASNVIAKSAVIRGTIRSFGENQHRILKARFKAAVENLVPEGVTAELVFDTKYPVLSNTGRETRVAINAAREVVGVHSVPPVTMVPKQLGSEDFAFYTGKNGIAGNFIALGTGPQDGSKAPDLHDEKYDFNDAALAIGASYFVKVVEKELGMTRPPIMST